MPWPVTLFDVDGTLVHAAGAGRRSMERALGERCGPLDGRLEPLRLDGSTDRLIVRDALGLLGRPFDEATCDAVLDRYLEHLAVEIAAPGYRVLPGVAAALESLRERGAVVGLCTGNVAGGARLKLARGGLDRYFAFDGAGVYGFAADGEARERIVEAALRRASARLARRLDPGEALVVGDTPRDVAAARHAGCPVLAVATGSYGAAELAACGADHVVESLEDPAAVRLLVG
ncbi:MAG TPA: HAD family hydrolase [Anaeromyxobacteraceae bacterium]|nr:HAD family hydrolase [Anaeromyxobacteraceae bacterium]